MTLTPRLRILLIVGVVVVGGGLLIALAQFSGRFTATRVQQQPAAPPSVIVVGGELAAGLPVGTHKLEFRGKTQNGERVTAATTVEVVARRGEGGPPPQAGGGGGGEPEPPPGRGRRVTELGVQVVPQGRALTLPAERAEGSTVRLVGDASFSSTEHREGTVGGTLLAHGRVHADYRVSVPRGKYLVELSALHDRPAPVRLAIGVNNKTWKVVEFRKGNSRIERLPIGVLRNFGGGRITIRFLNDFFDRERFLRTKQERFDRNAFIDAIVLTPIQ